MSDLPLLIIAQSARFLAQSAARAGYRVWAADCFNDLDMLACTERSHRLPALDSLSTETLYACLLNLSQGEACQLIYGGGMEHYPTLFTMLPDHIQLMGNTADTLNRINQPTTFFALLAELSLPFPKISWQTPNPDDGWLFKPSASLGGCDIVPAREYASSRPGYFQQHIIGRSASALFVANGETAAFIGSNQLMLSPAPNMPFRLGRIEAPFPLSPTQESTLQHAITMITQTTSLIGLNSLDFMIADSGELYLLEINPRPSASAELYEADNNMITTHLQACQQHTLPQLAPSKQSYRLLNYLYATTHIIVIPESIDWPITSHDLPATATRIAAQQPICTLVLNAKSSQHCEQQRLETETNIHSQLYLT